MTKILPQIYNYHYSYDYLKSNTKSNYQFIDAKLNRLPEFTSDYFNKLLKNKSSRKKLSSLYQFCNIIKRRFVYESTELQISQCNDKYLKNYFTQQKLSDVIKEAIKFNILILKSQSKINKCKVYIGVQKNMQEFIKKCKENDIKLPIYDIDEQTNIDSLLNTDLIKFSSKLNIKTNPKILNAYKESIVKNVLYKKYPELKEYQNLANEINFKYYKDCPELAIKFEPTIHFSSKSIITKIGIRYTCDFANYPKNELDDEGIRYPINRSKYINDNDFKFEHDVKSSVPRVAYLLKNKEWLGESVDLYEIIWKEFKLLAGDNDDSVWNEYTRDFIKTLFMEVYFSSSASQCRSNLIKKFKDNTGKDAPESDIKDIQLGYELLFQVINKMFYRCDSEIFYWESLLYMKVLKELLDNGYQVATCYDCFYAKKDEVTQQEFDKYVSNIIKEKALEVINP